MTLLQRPKQGVKEEAEKGRLERREYKKRYAQVEKLWRDLNETSLLNREKERGERARERITKKKKKEKKDSPRGGWTSRYPYLVKIPRRGLDVEDQLYFLT